MSLPDDIYSQRILELAANIPRTERLFRPDATASAHSKLCGRSGHDRRVDAGQFGDRLWAKREGLPLGPDSAAVMGREIVGSTAAELRAVSAQMRKMLKEGGPPPSGRWADLAVIEAVRDYKARHASTLLVFDAVEDTSVQIEANCRTADAQCARCRA